MNKDELVSFLEDFKKIVATDGGDYEILEAEDNYIKLKIKGKKNRKTSSGNLYALIKFTLQKKFPTEKIKTEYEHWDIPQENQILKKIKKWLNIK